MTSSGGDDEERSEEQKVDASPGAEQPESGGREGRSEVCPLCGAALTAVRCELICSNCGYREDCSDIFPAS